MSPTETHAAAGNADGTVFVWELSKQSVVARLKEAGTGGSGSIATGSNNVVACAWSPAGLPLVSCSKTGAIAFWGNQNADS